MDDLETQEIERPQPSGDDIPSDQKYSVSELALVKQIAKRIKRDKEHHEPVFAQMRRDMFVARTGRIPEYPAANYKVNLAGRHVKQKTASLYAKNPKVTARRRETLDFTVWDETQQSLEMAFQAVQMAQQMLAAAPMAADPVTGEPVPATPPSPEAEIAFQTAQAVLEDYQQGTKRRQEINKLGKTLEILMQQAFREQQPLNLKMAMKQCVRRACTTGVAYCELGFQREYGRDDVWESRMDDARGRLAHLERLTAELSEEDADIDAPEVAELQASMASLQSEPEIILREGLVFDFPQSTRVIPDRLTRALVGFLGARHLTIEYLFTPDQVEEMFGVSVGKKGEGYTPYSGAKDPTPGTMRIGNDDEDPSQTPQPRYEGLVCVWKHYDKVSGLVYYLADGHDCFLKPPAAPDVFVESFWPVYTLTFNEVEDESTIFPPSDVFLVTDQNMAYNRARQGMYEHRRAAVPRWAYPKGAIEEADVQSIEAVKPFQAVALNMGPNTKVSDLLQAFPIPGVDPNLYETGQTFQDIMLAVGSSESQMGTTSQATATESAIAANAGATSDSASVDDLDSFLSMVVGAGGQILMKEMSEEKVKEIAGVGAVWPHQTLAEIADELYLEIEAGSSGKPNRAIEVENFKQVAPLLMQIPGIQPEWLARQAIKVLDDRIDLTEAVGQGISAIVAMNRMQQPLGNQGAAPADPNADQTQQGAEGGDNGPQPQETQPGSDPQFGSNQV